MNTDQQILKKAIEKAVKGGWDKPFPVKRYLADENTLIAAVKTKDYYRYIFSHDFAKSFFGEEETDFSECPYCEYPGLYAVPAYQYHLQQLVLEPEDLRIKYLEKFF